MCLRHVSGSELRCGTILRCRVIQQCLSCEAIILRILFTFAGGNGHFQPLVPTAHAAQARGHRVAVAGRHALVPTIEAAGFTAFGTGKPYSAPPQRLPLLPLDPEREDRDLRNGFADRLARSRAADLLTIAQAEQPDLIVCDEVDFGAMLAAEVLGLPDASVVVIAAGSFIRPEVVGPPLHQLRAEYGLPADPALTMLRRYLVLNPVPPSFRDPAYPLPPTAHSIRPQAAAKAGANTPAWATTLPGAPVVYFTLGTVFNLECGDLFGRVLAGLRDLPFNVVATTGSEIDPAELGPQPPHIHLARYLPQADVLPYCDLTISHGGSGSVIGALAHGLPMVLIPMGADQPHNARRCEALGVGRTLDALHATPDDVRAAVTGVLNTPSYRTSAARLRAEFDALPGAGYAVTLLERLAAERAPLLTK